MTRPGTRAFSYDGPSVSKAFNDTSYFFHHDRLGSDTDVTSSVGAAQWDYI